MKKKEIERVLLRLESDKYYDMLESEILFGETSAQYINAYAAWETAVEALVRTEIIGDVFEMAERGMQL